MKNYISFNESFIKDLIKKQKQKEETTTPIQRPIDTRNVQVGNYIRLYQNKKEIGYFKVMNMDEYGMFIQKCKKNGKLDPTILFTVRMDDNTYKYKIVTELHSVGIAAYYKNRLLAVHQAKETLGMNYSYPKGKAEPGETLKDTAIREVTEEIGIQFDESMLKDDDLVNVKEFKGDILKTYYCYIVKLSDNEYTRYVNFNVLSKDNLQLDEIDWCGFLNKEEAQEKLNQRYSFLLNFMY